MLVSVIIPHRDRILACKKAIDSVLLQDYENFELIVVDDGSQENISELKAYSKEKEFKLIETEHFGVSHARNLGVEESRGEVIAFLDSDDCWRENKLGKQIIYFKNDKDCNIVHSNETWIRNNKFVNPKMIHEKASDYSYQRCLELCCVSPSSVAMRKDLFFEYGGFDELMPVCEDYDLWLRISVKNRFVLIEDELVIKYGGHEDQLSRSIEAMDRFRVYSILKLLVYSAFGFLELDSAKKIQALGELTKKSNVVFVGATKRSLLDRASLFKEIFEFSSKFSQLEILEVFDEQLIDLFERVKLEICESN